MDGLVAGSGLTEEEDGALGEVESPGGVGDPVVREDRESAAPGGARARRDRGTPRGTDGSESEDVELRVESSRDEFEEVLGHLAPFSHRNEKRRLRDTPGKLSRIGEKMREKVKENLPGTSTRGLDFELRKHL